MVMSTKTRSLDATYPARARSTRPTRSKPKRRKRSTVKRKSVVKQSAHSSAFSLALSVGIIGSVGLVAVLSFVLLGG